MKREIISDPVCYFKNTNKFPLFFTELSSEILKKNGEIYIVGGWVRDALLGIYSPDFDFEVYGLNINELRTILGAYGKVDIIGKFFGVLNVKINGNTCNFAVPRKESSIGLGHKDFFIDHQSNPKYEDAAIRRDFTINAMGVKLSDRTFVDPFGGFEDLAHGILRHVSKDFTEDPLRVLRAVRFASKLGFVIHDKTIDLCKKISLNNLSRERIFDEFKKILLESPKPSIGMEWLRKVGGLKIFPELNSLIGLEQNPEWHPEGDVWTHNNKVLDNAAGLTYEDNQEKLTIMLAALCHDFGKAQTTKKIQGKIVSPRHELHGAISAEKFLKRLTDQKQLIEDVVKLVREHSMPWQLYNERKNVTDAAIRRLSLRVNIKKLLKLVEADFRGKGVKEYKGEFSLGVWLEKKAKELEVLSNKPKPVLTGKMLLKSGIKEGPLLGKILKEAYELQLEGKISNEKDAMDFLQNKFLKT